MFFVLSESKMEVVVTGVPIDCEYERYSGSYGVTHGVFNFQPSLTGGYHCRGGDYRGETVMVDHKGCQALSGTAKRALDRY